MKNKSITLVFAFLFSSLLINAQESKIMALYIYNFVRYVEWPVSSQNGNFVIGVVGESPISDELEKIIVGKKVNNQAVILKKISNTDQATFCHVLFISEKYCDKVDGVTNSKNNTLMICERKGVVSKSSAISFIRQDTKIKFEINKENIKKSGLYVNNQLEFLATNVTK
jgi:hypothetical protein